MLGLTPKEIMDRLEERVGPEGRKLFEQFLRKVNKLQALQQLETQAQMGVTVRSGERGPVFLARQPLLGRTAGTGFPRGSKAKSAEGQAALHHRDFPIECTKGASFA